VLVVTRDIVIVAGTIALHYLNGTVRVRPSWTGKTATAMQMIAIALCMLQLNFFHLEVPIGSRQFPVNFLDLPVCLAGFFTLISGFGYVADGIRQLHTHGHADSKPANEHPE